MKKIALACLLVLTSANTVAAESITVKDAEKAVSLRQSVHALMYDNMIKIKKMADDKITYNQQAVESSAQNIAQLSKMVVPYFATDTSALEVASKSAKAVWTNSDDIINKANALIDASSKLVEMTKSGDKAAINKGFGATMKACKACHADYKLRK